MSTNAEKLFTVAQVAKILNVSQRTIWRWIEDGTISRVIRIGNPKKPTIRIPAETLENLGVKISYEDGSKKDGERWTH